MLSLSQLVEYYQIGRYEALGIDIFIISKL